MSSAGRANLDSGEVKELLYTEATWKGADRHEQETEEEPRGGVQGEGCAGGDQGGTDVGGTGAALRCASQSDQSVEAATAGAGGGCVCPAKARRRRVRQWRICRPRSGSWRWRTIFHMAPVLQLNASIPRARRLRLSSPKLSGNATRRPESTMDQAHIRGLGTAVHLSVAGLPRSWLGDHAQVARPLKNHEDSPHRAKHRVADPTVVSMCCRRILRMTRLRDDAGGFPRRRRRPLLRPEVAARSRKPVFYCREDFGCSIGRKRRAMSQTNPTSSRAMAAQVLF